MIKSLIFANEKRKRRKRLVNSIRAYNFENIICIKFK